MDTVTVAGRSSVEELELRLVLPPFLPVYWQAVEQFLLQAPEHWSEHFSLKDIYTMAMDGRCQLWAAFDEGGLHIAGLTEVKEYPQKRVMRIIWIGGENLKKALPGLGYLELWAKKGGCSTIEVLGRPGWLRVLKPFDYREKAVYLEKDISDLWEM